MRPAIGLLLMFGCAPTEVWVDPTLAGDDDEGVDTTPVDVETDAESDEGVELPAGPDRDGDGVVDDEDLCPDVPDPANGDMDGDGDGDACDLDRDGDQIPDDRDLFPDDRVRPGVASQDHVYAHSPTDLWRLDVPSRTLVRVGGFTFDRSAGQVTDVAIDLHGVLYAVTFYDLFVCHPERAVCWWVGRLPGTYNGLTFVPDATGTTDVLVGITTGGTWTALHGVPFGLQAGTWGGYGQGYASSGDAYHIRSQGTYAAVNKAGRSAVTIAEVDTTGRVLREVVELTGHSGVYGIGGWTQTIFAFSSNGDVIEIKPATGDRVTIARGPSWWGAGVKTIVVP